MLVTPLATRASAGPLTQALAAAPELDTGTLVCLTGRWLGGRSIIAWAPTRVLLASCPPDAPVSGVSGTALGGGWFGWQAYDEDGSWWGYFETVLRQDAAGAWWLESIAADATPAALAAQAAVVDDIVERTGARPGQHQRPRFHSVSRTARDAHLAAVERAIAAIRSGALYQVNVCARFDGRLEGSPLDLFASGLVALRADNAAYAAYLHTPSKTLVSFSPELMLERQGRRVRSEPIKGTRQRTVCGDRLDDPDAVLLRRSAKDRAENIMIVDLMRNDLSRVAEPGSVRTDKLLAIEPAPGVWHLVSAVSATLAADRGPLDLQTASFPPGSVTGAPKIRAVALIAELEGRPRGAFTGAIGYHAANDTSVLSVAIRTFEFDTRSTDTRSTDTRFELGVGGGITAESVPMLEWQECLIKAAPLLRLGDVVTETDGLSQPVGVDPSAGLLETMLVADGVVVGLSDHLARLSSSAVELFGRQLPAGLAGELTAAARAVPTDVQRPTASPLRQRLRLVITDSGAPEHTITAIGPRPEPLRLQTWPGRGGNWRHKWRDRRYLEEVEALVAGTADLPLFTDDDGRYAYETSRGNVAHVPRPGVLVTPTLTDDVLPGITRRRLLDAAGDHGWLIELRPVEVTELFGTGLVLSLGSLGISVVQMLDGQRLEVDPEIRARLGGWLPEFIG
jgi:para-aminobenzoate synthetase/4-amino-4-deoxychorismate lyase